ncbi:hypothetical protein C1646_775620 [Rhizophagus diaphanus]|nr:hypothetical protein C1646_775620 [Rhizophagus diaphanus] [Rhizophagus sp. MUCL 43196]
MIGQLERDSHFFIPYYAVQVVNDRKLEKFWKDLKIANIDDGFLYLPDYKKPYLFVRNCYVDLKDVILNSKIKRVRITGNPGIGKTYFSYYLLHILSKQKETVIYHEANENPVLFSEERVLCSETLFALREYLNDPKAWYVVDGQHPTKYDAKTIVVSSPMKSHYRNFDKWGKKLVRYMPEWKFEEINKCREKLFDDLGKDQVMNLYLKWGGVPRFVLENANDETEQEKLSDAIDTCSDDIIKYIGEGDSQEDISHKLVHIVTNLPEDRTNYPPYSQKIIKFASRYVGEKVTLKLETTLRNKLISEMNVALKFGKSNQVLGNVFEVIAHTILRKGGYFKVRSLNNNVEDVKEIYVNPQNRTYMFFDVSEIEDGKYFQPYEENFPSIDAINAPGILYQMTTTTNHNTKITGLEKLNSKLSSNEIILYYVVPIVLFNRFPRQNFIGDNIWEQNKWEKRISQYVLGIDIYSIRPKANLIINSGSDFNVRNVSGIGGSIRRPNSTWKRDDRTCYRCGEKGYISRYCKSQK